MMSRIVIVILIYHRHKPIDLVSRRAWIKSQMTSITIAKQARYENTTLVSDRFCAGRWPAFVYNTLLPPHQSFEASGHSIIIALKLITPLRYVVTGIPQSHVSPPIHAKRLLRWPRFMNSAYLRAPSKRFADLSYQSINHHHVFHCLSFNFNNWLQNEAISY
jgi:hypothetical protein